MPLVADCVNYDLTSSQFIVFVRREPESIYIPVAACPGLGWAVIIQDHSRHQYGQPIESVICDVRRFVVVS